MHYKNGKEAKAGDKVVGTDHNGNPVAGIVTFVCPGATTCNINVVPCHPHATYNSSQFVLADDALNQVAPVAP